MRMIRFRFNKPIVSARPKHALVEASAMKKEKSSRTNPRRVTFQDGSGTIHRVENASRMSKREKRKRWVSGKDFVESKQNCIKEVQILQMAEDRDIFAYRGLEMVDPDAISKRRIHHRAAISAVLNTQDKQRLNGKCKPKEIRKIYKAVVTPSVREAFENAYLDRKAVVSYLGVTIEAGMLESDPTDSNRGMKPRSDSKRVTIPQWPSSSFASSVSNASQISQIAGMLETYTFADGSERGGVVMSA